MSEAIGRHAVALASVHELAARSGAQRVVLLVDVSGSMSAYADALLRLAHRLTQSGRTAGGTVETFTVGTRLTHVTRALRSPDADRAIVAPLPSTTISEVMVGSPVGP